MRRLRPNKKQRNTMPCHVAYSHSITTTIFHKFLYLYPSKILLEPPLFYADYDDVNAFAPISADTALGGLQRKVRPAATSIRMPETT